MTEAVGPYRGIVFLHIPKTGGTSVRTALRQFSTSPLHVSPGRGILRLSDEELRKHDLIHGHMQARFIERPALKDYIHAVILRDPFDRFISEYNWGRKVVDDGGDEPAYKFAASVGPFECFISEFGARFRSHLTRLGYDGDEPVGGVPMAKVLARAKERLSRMVVGIFPDFGPFVQYLAQQTGRDVIPAVPKKRVTAERYKSITLTEKQVRIMKYTLRPDYELFDFARERARALYGAPEASEQEAHRAQRRSGPGDPDASSQRGSLAVAADAATTPGKGPSHLG